MIRRKLKCNEELPEVTIEVTRRKGQHEWVEQYTGYEVRYFKKDWSNTCYVEFISADGMTAAAAPEEILSTDTVFLARQKHNECMTYRLVISADMTGRRWCKNITEVISVEEEA